MLEAPWIPPLHGGDRLTRPEFERRFDAMPHLKKAELLDGIVYLPGPVPHTYHAAPHFNLASWLGVYKWGTPGVQGGISGHVRLDLNNEPQPDGYLRILPSHGGQSRLGADKVVEGIPEWIGEVAYSSASYDLHVKFDVYRRSGVGEYLVWRTYDRVIDWFVNREGQLERTPPDDDGIFRCEHLPGLWLDSEALLADDLAQVISVANKGLATPEHAAFVAQLQKAAALNRATP